MWAPSWVASGAAARHAFLWAVSVQPFRNVPIQAPIDRDAGVLRMWPALWLGAWGLVICNEDTNVWVRHQWGEDVGGVTKASGAAAGAFLGPDGRPPRAGQLQRNPDLAATFRCVAQHGALEGALPALAAESELVAPKSLVTPMILIHRGLCCLRCRRPLQCQ